MATLQAQMFTQLNLNFLRNFTLALYAIAAIISFFAVLLDLYRVEPAPADIAAEHAEQFNDLKRSFNELGDKEGTS